MAGPLLATKLYLPRLRRGLVPRPQLMKRLGSAAEARLTLVSAPAGFGKTTLLASWLTETSSDERSVAWLSLDPSDSDPAVFWTYVVTALRGVVPGFGAAVLDLVSAASAPTEVVLTTLVNDLDLPPRELWLVLDDYHLVDSSVLGEGLAFLLEHLPPHVHVVISTRADPVLPLSRWRARGELVEIRAADLRFTSAETDAYLREVKALPLTSADVDVLGERTEGWVAALQLAALSLQGRTDPSAFIARFAGDDRYIMDYLVEEVLAHQTEREREFLLRSAVLDRLSGSLCDAVTGGGDGTRMLATLERAGLFLVTLDDRREWYRYHHLFADVLRARLLAEEPDLVAVLHRRASGWLAQHGAVEEAVDHSLAAQDFDRAAHLMEMVMPAIRRHRRESRLLTWLPALPDPVVRRSPVLSAFSGHLLLASGDVEAAERRLVDAERALAAGPDESFPWADTEELRTLPATIAIYRASLAQARGDVRGTVVQAQRALDLAGPHDHLARGGAAGFLALAAWAQGDVSGARETFTHAVASLHAAGNLVDALSSTVVLGDLWLAAGRPHTARRVYERALQQAADQAGAGQQVGADLHVGLSELDYESGDLDGARRHLDAAASLAKGDATAQGRYRWFLASGRIAGASGDVGQAVDLLDQAQELYRPGFFPAVRPIPAIKARIWIAHGHLSEAADWARDRRLSVMDEPGYLTEFEHLTFVRLLLAEHRAEPSHLERLDEAAVLLDRLQSAAAAVARAGSLVEIHLLQALRLRAQGDRTGAVRALGQALAATSEPDGYARVFLDEGQPMTMLLHDAERHDSVVREHARRLLGLLAEPDPEAPPEPGPFPARASGETLSDRELQVLRLLSSELSGPLIARELFVSHNTLRTHTKHIFAKLGVSSRRAAVQRALERGLL